MKTFIKNFHLSKTFTLILFGGALSKICLVDSTSAKSKFSDLDQFVQNLVQTEFMPESQAVGLGLTISSVQNDTNFIYSKGFGYQDVEKGVMATNTTLFAIGSITKSFAATLIIKILNEKFPTLGESVVDMPIRKLAATINLTLSDRYRTESMSFRDLLSHRSCLSSHILGNAFGAISNAQEFLYRRRYENEICPFRSRFVYNDAMVVLAGDLISQLSGKSFEELFQNFLHELGMMESRLVNFDEDLDLDAKMAAGYYIDEKNGVLKKGNSKLLNRLALVTPAGGALSSGLEMGKYIQFHLNHGHVNDQQIVSKEVMKWLSRIAIPIDQGAKGYGMGFFVDYEKESGQLLPLLSHGGYAAPFTSLLTLDLVQNVGFFTTTNGPGLVTPTSAHTKLHNKLLAYFSHYNERGRNFSKTKKRSISSAASSVDETSLKKLDGIFPKLLTNNNAQEKERKRRNAVNCTDDAILGNFGNGLEGEFKITLLNDEAKGQILKIDYGRWGHGILTKMEDCCYKIEWTGDFLLHTNSWADGLTLTNLIEILNHQDNDNQTRLRLEVIQGEEIIFEQNLTLANLPKIPYEPDSCAPESMAKAPLLFVFKKE